MFSHLVSRLSTKRRKSFTPKKTATSTTSDKGTISSSTVLTPSSSTTAGGRRVSGTDHLPPLDNMTPTPTTASTATSSTAATLPPLPLFRSYQTREFDVDRLEFSESRDLARLLDINWSSVKDQHDLVAFPAFEHLVSGVAYNRSSPIGNNKEERRFSFHKPRSAAHLIKRAKSTPDFAVATANA
ncbi:hypothetical protein BX666DRAFT_1881779 [Dichotomocladium elegans]|nr:hypothetical protein BX666DRAFT_1881779 [Dichotomocladium elegans]